MAVPGGVLIGETWAPAGSPYCVTGDLELDRPTIEPGVEVLVEGPYNIDVAPTITAAGTPDAPIVFTARSPSERWNGLRFETVTPPPGTVIEACESPSFAWPDGDTDEKYKLLFSTAPTFAGGKTSGGWKRGTTWSAEANYNRRWSKILRLLQPGQANLYWAVLKRSERQSNARWMESHLVVLEMEGPRLLGPDPGEAVRVGDSSPAFGWLPQDCNQLKFRIEFATNPQFTENLKSRRVVVRDPNPGLVVYRVPSNKWRRIAKDRGPSPYTLYWRVIAYNAATNRATAGSTSTITILPPRP